MIGKRLTWSRKYAGLSLSQAAILSDLDIGIIQSFENFDGPASALRVDFPLLKGLCKIYGVSLNWVLDGTQPEAFEVFLLNNHSWLMEQSALHGVIQEFMDLWE